MKQRPAWESHYQGIPSFNLIPPEYRWATILRRRLCNLLLLLMIAVVASFIPGLYQRMSAHEAAIETLQADIEALEAQWEVINARKDEAEGLLTAIRGLKEEHEGLQNQRQQDWDNLGIDRSDWSLVVAVFFRSRPPGVELSSLHQRGLMVTINGKAPDHWTLLQYRNLLLASPAIDEITHFQKHKTPESLVSFSMGVVVRMVEE